ncbi:MAG TPA: biotin--[acetyl-CoA-carboxylase] ligase [Methanoregulaceae archaeon]|nr:biotin--[acetyl-CoA-carboxylase] ligase [Methanolinea sp.]MDD3091592.1 biotin--[acetyl-CoA-carboxylase] ligase [Methanoregulaceae archaeon]MDD5049867.1 biotin--[acetyl-CoA-carboxylase] ligase [Methanoregulaceae archaeon]MDD5685151.1 biotin--[acetyl-CoA-carboxylase] ligase [Methanoregulaceae archaeon]HOP66627.1 biotin--[acetyl-CoA-carboxylase] ligase [Methanoregulaceae archaeon]
MYDAAFRVLEILESSDGPVSGESISNKLGISRSAVWKHVKELKNMGYEISSSQKGGYKLEQKSDRLLPHEIRKKLRTRFIGKKMKYFENTPSTIWVGKKLASEGDAANLHGLVIIAEEQTGGIGRLGRSWVSPAGGIWITIVLKPKIPVDHVFMVTMAASVAVARAIRKEFDLGALIKWPNDVYIGDNKVAGLLLELSAEADTIHYCLLGIGIDVNIAPNELEAVPSAATSISSEVGYDVDRASFLARILREFESRYLLMESEEYEPVLREWKSLSCTLEHRVRINTLKTTFEGEAIDIDEFGALLIRKDNGKVVRVIAGDCIHQ